MALAASLVATHIYFASLQEGEEAVMKEGDAWMMVGGLSGGWICFGAAFLLLMKQKYVATIFSTQTGFQYVQNKFLREGDENKKAVFKYVRAKRAQRRHGEAPSPPPAPLQQVSRTQTLLLRSQVQQEVVAVHPGRREDVDA
jgi:hypothetical protein